MESRAVSLKFNKVNENGYKIISKLLDNQNFLRYITYLEDNPLSTRLPDISKDKVINNGINEGNFLLLPFDDKILTKARITVFFYPYEINNLEKTISDDVYILDIIVPNQYFVIANKFEWRVYTIANEIANSLDQKSGIGVDDIEIVRVSRPYKAADGYSGISIFIKVKNATIKGR